MQYALNAALEGITVKTALHVCFGNAHNNSFATPRRYRPLYPRLLDATGAQRKNLRSRGPLLEKREKGRTPVFFYANI